MSETANPGDPAFAQQTDPNAPGYVPVTDPNSPDYDPALDPSHPEFDPERDRERRERGDEGEKYDGGEIPEVAPEDAPGERETELPNVDTPSE